jgi:hypothetical protein
MRGTRCCKIAVSQALIMTGTDLGTEAQEGGIFLRTGFKVVDKHAYCIASIH